MKKRIFTAFILLAFFWSGCGRVKEPYFETAEASSTEAVFLEEQPGGTLETEMPKERECFVYVCGAVQSPGVYSLPPGSRIYEAVRMAGGLREDALEDGVNQAQEVTDGQMIKVPTKEEAAELEGGASPEGGISDGKVNINTADADTLMTLPGIGASKAESILAYRKERGGFSAVEEIKNIAGIKDGVYSKIKDYITVN